MGLTFEQQFYHIPDEVFLVFHPDGRVCAIMEIPEDESEKIKLQTIIGLSTGLKFEIINFDTLVREGIKIRKEHESLLKNSNAYEV